MISVKNVDYTYESAQYPALCDVSLDVKEGEFLCIVGHNGSGKSTLAKMFNALLLPTFGTVNVRGMDTADSESVLSIRQLVGMVFQNPDNQLVTTVVREDVAFGPENLGVPTEEMIIRVDKALRAVGMEDYADSAPHMLSGGQKQRIAIAGMLAMNPQALLLDEATAMLDPMGRRDILNIVKKLNREKRITVIMITQYMEEAIDADRIIVMNDGRIVMSGAPREIFTRGKELKAIGLDVPPAVELRDMLISKGIMKPCDALTDSEIIEKICRLL